MDRWRSRAKRRGFSLAGEGEGGHYAQLGTSLIREGWPPQLIRDRDREQAERRASIKR